MRAGLIYRPAGRKPPQLLGIIYGIPDGTPVADVTRAVENWREWPTWQSRVALGARLTVTLEPRWPKNMSMSLATGAEWPWEHFAPVERVISVRVPGELYGEIVRDARGRSMTIQAWCATAFAHALAPAGEVPIPWGAD